MLGIKAIMNRIKTERAIEIGDAVQFDGLVGNVLGIQDSPYYDDTRMVVVVTGWRVNAEGIAWTTFRDFWFLDDCTLVEV